MLHGGHNEADAAIEARIEALKWLTAPTQYAVPYTEVFPAVFELRNKQLADKAQKMGR